MKLYPHNRKAYLAAVEKFKTGNRACIVQPCGTGKGMIIAKFILDNPKKTHLLLAPGRHIKREILKHINGEKILFCTYAGLKSSDYLLFTNAFDFIYVDEIHRLGADDWGPVFQQLLDRNSDAKVLGTTATPIRYLDGNRNMANEIFGGCIASEMTLADAFALDILPEMKYVRAKYNCGERLENLMRELEASDKKSKERLSRELEAGMIDWENSEGIDKIIKTHLTPDRRRVIVFCKNQGHMQQMQEKFEPVFISIYGTVQCVAIHSNFSPSKNTRSIAEFTREDDQAVILFTVDMVNEGLHSKVCNTVILLRDTQSPIVHYQQIGRACSTNGIHNPLVIDLVNNFKNMMLEKFTEDITRKQGAARKAHTRGEGDKIKLPVNIFDEELDIASLLSKYEIRLINDPQPLVVEEISKTPGGLKIENCIDRLVAHFKKGNIENMKAGIRYDFTRVQSCWLEGGLQKEDLEYLDSARVPIVMNNGERDWLDNAKKTITFFDQNNRLPGFADGPDLYDFWLREYANMYLKHRFKELFRANIDAERLYNRLISLIIEYRGKPRLHRKRKP